MTWLMAGLMMAVRSSIEQSVLARRRRRSPASSAPPTRSPGSGVPADFHRRHPPLREDVRPFGRRIVYQTALSVFIVGSVPCVAPTMQLRSHVPSRTRWWRPDVAGVHHRRGRRLPAPRRGSAVHRVLHARCGARSLSAGCCRRALAGVGVLESSSCCSGAVVTTKGVNLPFSTRNALIGIVLLWSARRHCLSSLRGGDTFAWSSPTILTGAIARCHHRLQGGRVAEPVLPMRLFADRTAVAIFAMGLPADGVAAGGDGPARAAVPPGVHGGVGDPQRPDADPALGITVAATASGWMVTRTGRYKGTRCRAACCWRCSRSLRSTPTPGSPRSADPAGPGLRPRADVPEPHTHDPERSPDRRSGRGDVRVRLPEHHGRRVRCRGRRRDRWYSARRRKALERGQNRVRPGRRRRRAHPQPRGARKLPDDLRTAAAGAVADSVVSMVWRCACGHGAHRPARAGGALNRAAHHLGVSVATTRRRATTPEPPSSPLSSARTADRRVRSHPCLLRRAVHRHHPGPRRGSAATRWSTTVRSEAGRLRRLHGLGTDRSRSSRITCATSCYRATPTPTPKSRPDHPLPRGRALDHRQICRRHRRTRRRVLRAAAPQRSPSSLGRWGLRVPSELDDHYHLTDAILPDQRPVAFHRADEHHSNELPWRESIADVVTIARTPTATSTRSADRELARFVDRPLRSASFSAACNVTGILTDTDAV